MTLRERVIAFFLAIFLIAAIAGPWIVMPGTMLAAYAVLTDNRKGN